MMQTDARQQRVCGKGTLVGWIGMTLVAITLLARTNHTFASAIAAPEAVPTIVIHEEAGGFELYQKGIYWWGDHSSAGSLCGGGEFYYFWTLKLQGTFGAPTKTNVNKQCFTAPANVVRDSQYVYYVDETHHLVRKAVNATATDPATPLTQAGVINHSLLAIDALGRLYWSVRIDNALMIMRMKTDNSESPTLFAGLTDVINNITGMVAYRTGSISTDPTDAIAFTIDNKLWLYTSKSTTGRPVLLSSNVSDFTVRISQTSGPFPHEVATFYAATTTGLVRINSSGNTTLLYPSAVDWVTVDDANLYISVVTHLPCPPGQFCNSNVAIYRRALNAPDNGTWDLIVAQGGGSNLRSDGQFLYFMSLDSILRSTGIAKVPTDAPPVQIDVEALDLEVTQAIQDMNESFSLIGGHPTVVRGYARLAISNEAEAYTIDATLTGKLDGVALPGGPLFPRKYIKVDKTTNKQTMRANATLTFLFVLPETWVQWLPKPTPNIFAPSHLTLEMTVNPSGGAPPENVGADPLANNKASATIPVQFSTRPCLMAIPVRADHQPVLDQEPSSLVKGVDRARSLMPVRDFRLFTNYSSTDLEDNYILSENGDSGEGYDMNHSNADPDDDDSDGALGDLDDLDAWSSEWQRCGDLHWLGMINPSSPVRWGGISYRNDNVLLAKIGGVEGTGYTIAHELAHNYGRRHINCGDFPPGQDNFDFTLYDPCHLYFTNLPLEATFYGFDFFNLDSVKVKPPQNHPDIMSYASDKWTSYVYWLALSKAIPAFEDGAPLDLLAAQTQPQPTLAPAAGELLYVGGSLNFDGDTGTFNTVYRVPAEVAPPSKVAQSFQAQQAAALMRTDLNAASSPLHSEDNATIRQLSAANVVLAETVVLTKEESIHIGGQHRYSFSQYLPFDPQTRKVKLVHGGAVLAEQVASPNPPVVALAPPVIDANAETVTLHWAASDSDGDALHAMILYSNDDGAHWLPLDKNISGLEATFSTQSLAGGVNARLRLIVDDGFNTAVVTSSPFTINQHAPTPLIDGVVEGQRLPYTATTTLYGMALDVDEGSLESQQLTWSLSGPQSQVVSGTQVILAGLPPGLYAMTLNAQDSSGLKGAATRHFEVLPVSIPNGNAPQVDGQCSDAAYAEAVNVPLGGQGAQASLLHSGGTLYVCFSGLTSGPPQSNRVVGLRVDANNSRDATAQSDDRGFFVDEDNIPFQTVGNGSDMPVTLSPALGYATATSSQNQRWSAELSIAEVLVGGWGHSANLLFQLNISNPADNIHNWPTAGFYNQPNTWAAALLGVGSSLANRAPVAKAGGDQVHALHASTTLALDSSASYDADRDSLTATWTQTAGPPVTLTAPTTTTVQFTASPVSAATVLRFQLTVSDGQASSLPDEVTITLLPPKPLMAGAPGKAIYLPLVSRQ